MLTKELRFRLEKGSKKYPCPSCGRKTFVRYVDTNTGDYLPQHIGRCDREVKCQYHNKPDGSNFTDTDNFMSQPIKKPEPVSYIERTFLDKSVSLGMHSNFAKWLMTLFDDDTVSKLVETYNLGLSKKWDGATVFWQVDTSGNIRTGKVMLYDKTGHRVKEPYSHINWAHSLLGVNNYNLKQCFFGEHLIAKRPDAPIAIVESEKTAVIASVFIPEMIWMATGGKNGCRWSDNTVSNVIKDREVLLFPDLGCHADWKEKAKLLNCKNIVVSDLLEENATDEERRKGLDLADYLVGLEKETAIGFKPSFGEGW